MQKILMLLAAVILAAVVGGPFAHAQGKSDEMRWVKPKADADLVKLKKTIEGRGGKVLSLAPEGRLLVRYPSRAATRLSTLSAVESDEQFVGAAEPAQAEPAAHGLGARMESAEKTSRIPRVTSVEPNDLGIARAALDPPASQSPELQTLPASVDNSLSVYFPPIRSQEQQGSCVAWSTTYYYATYTHAMDENLNAASGDNNYICSPAFTYNMLNDGMDEGLVTSDGMDMLNETGVSSWALMPYNSSDYLTWPSEAAWVDALKRRMLSLSRIGNSMNALTDTDILALKQHLANGHIAVTSTNVFDNMYYTYPANTTGINNGVLFGNGATAIDGHAMTVVGYDDNKSYFDGTTTKYGAFLIANSWGTNWGTYNSAGTSKGFMWVGYDYFKGGVIGGYWVFGIAMYNTDRDNYRSRLYAVAGVNHAQRGRVILWGGIGPAATPAWMPSTNVLGYQGGLAQAIDDSKRVAVDLTDGIPYITWPTVNLFVQMGVSSSSGTNGSLTNTTFYHDFDGNGTYDSLAATNTPLTVAPGATASAEKQFTWSDGALDHFTWGAIGVTQTAYLPISATVSARDNLERLITGFTGTPTISASYETTTTVGVGTTSAWIPLSTYNVESRTQSIYLQSEIGQPQTLKGLMLNVSTIPPCMLQNFTIRLKHTSLTSFPGGSSWETGYTTVYRHHRQITATGWALFEFDTPFVYNGTSNLMMDYSFYNTTYAETDGYVYNTNTGVNRTTYSGQDYSGDPLTWTGTNPTLTYSPLVPNIKLISDHPLAVTPASTGSFSAGTWTGTVTINEAAAGVYLKVDDGAGHIGRSNAFTVLAGTPPGSLTVTLGPSAAVLAGAQWRRSGQTAWRASGATETGIAPGYYSIEFSQVPGWESPFPQSVTVSSGATASVSASYTQMSLVWVDFAFGGSQFGTEAMPYSLLGSAVSAVASGGTIRLLPGTSSETPRVTKAVRLEAVGGTATIGR